MRVSVPRKLQHLKERKHFGDLSLDEGTIIWCILVSDTVSVRT
jgi:hypothetical protein